MTDAEVSTTREVYERVKRAVRSKLGLVNKAFLVVIVVFLLGQRWIEELAPKREIANYEALLTPAFTLTFLGIIVELLLEIEDTLRDIKGLKKTPMTLHDSEIDAFRDLCRLAREGKIKKIDMVQFSGGTATSFFEELALSRKEVYVRILLYHPEETTGFDSDEGQQQVTRITGTVARLATLAADNKAFTATARYYRTPPGMCGILVNETMALCGWYRCFMEGKAMRVQSHCVPVISVADDNSLREKLREQFECLWARAEDPDSYKPGGQSREVQIGIS